MNEPQGNFIKLRNRNIPKLVPPTKKIETSTPIKKSPPNLENLRHSVQESTKFLRELSNNVDNNLSSLESVISSKMTCQPTTIYNKELADLMATNIPKFNLNSGNNPALGLRSFIKSCENVLNLFDPDDEDVVTEFFKLIKFRLGYDVQERLTIEQFDDIQSLENHLRSVCHLKLNKGKLLSEIRHEKQHFNEDVSNFVERLRKLIAQGRSEYPKDKEFEKEAIHTLKNSVKNELISIKLMDSDSNKFEELAELAINRDSDLHQRAYRTSKPNDSVSQDLVNELLQKIKKLEEKQTATIQHIRQEQKFKKINRYLIVSTFYQEILKEIQIFVIIVNGMDILSMNVDKNLKIKNKLGILIVNSTRIVLINISIIFKTPTVSQIRQKTIL